MTEEYNVESPEGQGSTSSHCYRVASEKIGHHFFSTTIFIVNALDWLGEKFGDVHLEYHEDAGGWQVSTCYADEAWDEDGWVRGDGSMASALRRAVEVTSR